MNPLRRPGALAPVLVVTALVTSVISSLGAPLIPTIAKHFDESLSTAQWSLTIALLSGAICAPVMGRLGDGPWRRATMVAGLAVVTLGGVIAALASGLNMLIVGRAMQGVGLGLVPLTMATAREELPKVRVAPMIALLSVAAAAGVGVGYPISGLIADALGLSGAFWFGAIVSAVALICVVIVVPPSRGDRQDRLDLTGALLLAGALVALLMAVAQGATWGWGSPSVLGLLVAGAAVGAGWARHQLHTATPLVELRLLRHPAVLAGNGCATVLGVAMYMNLSAVTEFVQVPRATGFGFSASVVVSGLILIPLSVFMLSGSRVLPTLVKRLGIRTLLSVGCLVVAASGSFFALFHADLWESFVMMSILGIGLGTTYAAIPGLIVEAVPRSETGSAMGFYQVVRYVGFSLGSALTAAILASHTSSATAQPALSGYTTVFWVAGAICLVAAIVAWGLASRGLPAGPAQHGEDEGARVLPTTPEPAAIMGTVDPSPVD